MNKIILIMILMILFVSPAMAEMRGSGRGMGMRYGYGPGRCADPELNLSPDQSQKVNRLQQGYLTKIRQLQREEMLKRAEWRLLSARGSDETSKLNRSQQEIQAIREKIRETWVNYKMECRTLLTPEQLEQLGTMEKGRWPGPGPDGSDR
jgi:Spy/CpxP family protein refolding chaperone